jgi:hypothetical protein
MQSHFFSFALSPFIGLLALDLLIKHIPAIGTQWAGVPDEDGIILAPFCRLVALAAKLARPWIVARVDPGVGALIVRFAFPPVIGHAALLCLARLTKRTLLVKRLVSTPPIS